MTRRLVAVASLLLALSLLDTPLGVIAPAAAHEGHAHAQPPAAAPARRAASPWGASYFPNVPLVTHEGKTVRFYDDLLKGRKVLINFIYTSCEDSCGLDTANMLRVQKLMAQHIGKDVFMYSITLDPEHDTPEVLKKYSSNFNPGPGWVFLTGKREDIDAVRYKFGQRDSKEEHANTVQIGDVDLARWIRIPLNSDPHSIAVEADGTLFPGPRPGARPVQAATADPRVQIYGPGQLLFYNRCAACHTIGKGPSIGPDLKGVTERREAEWLLRFVGAPNLMRAKKDPIALELAKQYKLPMPRVEMTGKELRDILAYLQAQDTAVSKREAVVASEQASAPDAHRHDHH